MPALLAKLSGALGAGLLILSAVLKWFRVPEGQLQNGILSIVTLEPHSTLFFKMLCLGTLTGAVILLVRRADRRYIATLFTFLFAVLLFYPCSVVTWSPAISARASWLQTQHENLSWLGGDIFNEQEYKDVAWKSHLIVGDTERQVGVFRLPNWSPFMVQWGQLGELFEWLGYTNRFCQFVNKGWFVALIGAALCLIPLARGADGLRYPVARAIGFTGITVLVAGIIIALTPPLLSGWLMMNARHAAHRGDHGSALRWLDASASVLPAIRYDTYFSAQKGLLDRSTGYDTPEARLDEATRLLRQGFAAQAHEKFDDLLTAGSPAVRREACRAFLREAIADLNRGNPAGAAALLSEVLEYEPCNLKALYALQLAGLRTGQTELVIDSVQRLRAIYPAFNSPTKAPVLASAAENLAIVASQAGDVNGAWKFRNQAIGRAKP